MRTKKAVLNASVSLLYQLTMIVCGLITPRFILNAFGSTYNGVIQSATQFLGMISVLTLGLAGATRVALYKPLAEKNTEEISKVMLATKSYLHKVGYAVLILTGLLMIFYPLVAKNDLSHIECSVIIGIISIGTFANYYFGVANQTLLMADQSNYVYELISTFATIINAVVTVVLIKLGSSVYIVKLGSSLIYFISPFILNLYIKKRYSIDPNAIKDDSVLKNRKAVMYHSVANIVHQDTPILMLTIFCDAKIISVYTVYYLVVGKIRTLLNSFTSGMEAVLGNMWANKENERLKTSFSGIEFLCYSFSIVIFSCVIVLLSRFVEIYTLNVTDINYIRPGFALLISMAEIAYCIRQPYLCLVQAAGFYNETKAGAIAEAVVNVLVSLIMVNVVGLSGVVLGTLAANIVRTIHYSWFVSTKILKTSVMHIITRVIWMVIVMLMIVGIASVALIRFDTVSWISLILCGIITFMIAVTIWLVCSLLFYKNDLKFVIYRMKRMIVKR